MIEAHLRTHSQSVFNSIASLLIPHVRASIITLCAFFMGIGASFAIALNYLLLGLVVLWFSGLLDVLDGTVARLSQTASKIGAYCDLISDRMVESAVILALSISHPEHQVAYVLFLAAVLLHFSTFVVAGALFPNHGKKSMHYEHSIIERAEAFIIFSCLLLWPIYISTLLIPFSLLIFGDGALRFIKVLRHETN